MSHNLEYGFSVILYRPWATTRSCQYFSVGPWCLVSKKFFCFIHLTNLPVYHEWHCHICLWKKSRWELNGVEREWFLSKVTSEKPLMRGHCECLCWFLVSGSHWCFLVDKETRRAKNTNINRSLDETQKMEKVRP